MRILLTSVVGSRLHGTAGPESDLDERSVFAVSLAEALSPFRAARETLWAEGDTDRTGWELRRFCKLAAHGNPTALETLVGEPTLRTPEGDALAALLPAFLSRRCVEAFFGYARNQERKFREERGERMWKYAATQTRVLFQLAALLRAGALSGTSPPETVDELKQIRAGRRTEAEVMARVFALEEECRRLALDPPLPAEPDLARIEAFVTQTYRGL